MISEHSVNTVKLMHDFDILEFCATKIINFSEYRLKLHRSNDLHATPFNAECSYAVTLAFPILVLLRVFASY
jgi:hypothetical protein